MHADLLASPSALTVARRPQSRLGWRPLGIAVLIHAALAGLLVQIHQAAPDVPTPIEVTLDLARAEAPAPAAEPAAAAAATPTPASEPEAAASPSAAAEPSPAPVVAAAPPPLAPVSVAPPKQPAAKPSPHPTLRAARPAPRPVVQPAARRSSLPQSAEPGLSGGSPSPVAPATAAPVPAPVQPPSAEAAGAWRGALAAWLQAHRTYPDAARRDGVEGRVVLRFTINAVGLVTAVALVDSSGSAVLDDAAETLLRSAHLPPPPAPAPDNLSITLPVSYRLAH